MWKEKVITVIAWLVRLIVALRYRIVVKGLDNLTPEQFKRPGGIVFLPNHPAEIDPVIVEMILWKEFRPRPLIVEHFYHLKGFKFFMDLVKGMPLPTMDVMANKWRGKKVEKQFNNVVSELKNKENFLIYPSGRLKVSGMELIGGASFIHNLLQACPEANVALVRTTGLWGSTFSRALTGASPDFGKVLWECFKILVKNGLLFAPRRDVLVEVELPPDDFPYNASRLNSTSTWRTGITAIPSRVLNRSSLFPISFGKKPSLKFMPQLDKRNPSMSVPFRRRSRMRFMRIWRH